MVLTKKEGKMLKKTQTILLFVLVLSGVVLVGGLPAVKAQTVTPSETCFDGVMCFTFAPDGTVISGCVIDTSTGICDILVSSIQVLGYATYRC